MDKRPLQLPLTISSPLSRRSDVPTAREYPARERVSGIDQMLDTHDVEKITGRHRCTIYRWVLAGTFPEKRAGGGRGWLRSDIERWLSGDPLCPARLTITRRTSKR